MKNDLQVKLIAVLLKTLQGIIVAVFNILRNIDQSLQTLLQLINSSSIYTDKNLNSQFINIPLV